MKPLSVSQKLFRLAGLLTILVLVLAACQPAASPTAAPTAAPIPQTAPTAAPTTPPTAAPTTPPAAEATLSVADNSEYGKILVDGRGMTLYVYTKDEPDKSNCSGNCLKAWPPLLTQGSPTLGDGVDKSLVATATLADGSRIVTYNHMPLYYWAKDKKAGDTTGNGVGGVWFLASPDGKVVGKEEKESVTPSPAAASETVLNVADNAEYGKILVDGKGMTLYIYTKDGPNQSNCSAGCLKAWPPFLSEGNVMTGVGVDQSMIGTATLADGSKIVTYHQMPLYYWASDTKAGDATGQNVGGVWFVIGPDGNPIKKQ
ncbi:MAG TPA: hypothetical protein VMT46_09080 [Anaerolineaceae bacterium]|nr:hypothetical protein [Anaerolineaceae bacterium]